MKIFEKKPGSSLSLRVLGAATQPGNSPLTEPRQALPATLRCPRAPKRYNSLCRHHSHWPGLAPRGQGGKIRRKVSGVPLGRAKDPGFLSSHGGAGASSRNTQCSQVSPGPGEKARLLSAPGRAKGWNFPRGLRTWVWNPEKSLALHPHPPTPTVMLLPCSQRAAEDMISLDSQSHL